MTRHRSVNHRRVAQITLRLRRLRGRVDQAAAIQSASSTAIWGTPLTWIAAIVRRRDTRSIAAPVRWVGAEEQADRAALVGDHQRALRQLVPPRSGSFSPGAGVADAEAPDLLPVEDAQRHPGLDDRDVERVRRAARGS